MSTADDFYQAAERVYGSGEAPDWPEVELPYMEMVEVMWEAERQQALWRSVVAEVKQQLLAQIGDHSFHDGEWLYRPTRRKARFLQDPAQLIRFLGDDPAAVTSVLKLDGPDPIRVTALRRVAESRGLDAGAVEDTLCRVEWGEPFLDKIRMDSDRCPEFVKRHPAGHLI